MCAWNARRLTRAASLRRVGLVWLVATSLGGCETLPNLPPAASFIHSPVSPIYAGQTAVSFSASASRDSDGHITSYVWNFGDGTPEVAETGPTVSHVFRDTPATCVDITYAVQLVVVDDKQERGFASRNVTVTELPAPGSSACLGR